MSQFKRISSAQASDTVPVTKYLSQRTGLTVVIADVEGPFVEGTYLVVTEPENNDGYPHALEHLILNGSTKYPYRGILSSLAEDSVAVSNADHTSFYFSVAGQDQALALLPIYTDHVLWPLLSEEGFVCDIHHINGDGEDGGLVYDEMKDADGNYNRCKGRLLCEMYANSGYAYDYYGKAENIRTLSNAKVKEFHRKFYRPENITLVLTGQLEHEAVFKALSHVEDDIIAKWISMPLDSYVKPWQKTPKPNYGEYLEHYPYPGLESDDLGLVSCNIDENTFSLLRLVVFDIPFNKLEEAKNETFNCIKAIRNGELSLNIDEIHKEVQKDLRYHRRCLEDNHHNEINLRCLRDALHSGNEDDFALTMNPQNDLKDLLEEPFDYWLDLFNKYFSDDVVIVTGIPSEELKNRIEEEEKKRIEDQKLALGVKGLADRDETLAKAKEFCERPLPSGTLDLVPLPGESLAYIKSSVWSSDSEPCPVFDLKDMPIYARVQNLKTIFVHINLILDTTAVDPLTRKWIPLLMASVGKFPVRGDALLRTELQDKIGKITESFDHAIGFEGQCDIRSFVNFPRLDCTVFPENYEAAVNLIHDVLYDADISCEILLDIAEQLNSSFEFVHPNPRSLIKEYVRNTLYSKYSNAYWNFRTNQKQFLNETIAKLKRSDEQVLEEAKTAYRNMTQRMWLHLATDFENFKLNSEPWTKFGNRNSSQPIERPYLSWDTELMSDWGGRVVTALDGIEGCHMTLLSPGPLGHAVQDVAPILVMTYYFAHNWLRSLNCDLDFVSSPNEACLELSLYEVDDAAVAYNALKQILNDYLADHTSHEDLLKDAKKHTLYNVLKRHRRPWNVVESSILNYIQRVDEQYIRELVKAISQVSAESVRAITARWLPTLLDETKTKLAILSEPCKLVEMEVAIV